MTTLDHRTPTALDGEFVENPSGPVAPPPMPTPKPGEVVPGPRQYVRNPYLASTFGAAGLVLIAASGLVWSVFRDYSRADLAFLAMLATIGWLVSRLHRFNAWDER